MDPTQNLKQIDPLAVLMDVLDAPNVVPGTRTDQAMPNQAHDAKPRPSDSPTQALSDGPAASSVPPVDTTFRPAADSVRRPDDRASFGRRAVRGLIGFLLALCIGIASFVWQSPYGDEARQRVASWMPQFALTLPQFVQTLFQPRENSELAAQPTPPADQAVAAATAPAQPAPPQPAAPAQTAPEAAGLSPESRQLLQSIARELATVEQGIEQLKASQEQLGRDNAKLAEQLKVNQERMTRVLAKASEARATEARASEARAFDQNLRPKLPARPPLPTATRELREPVSTLPPPQAIAPPPGTTPPQAATQPQADPDLPSVPRPPMPVR
jgi:hypothetical protein